MNTITKHFRKNFMLFLMFCLVMIPATVSQAKVNKAANRKLYKDFLAGNYATVTEAKKTFNIKLKDYVLLDIDRNGVEDLIVKSADFGIKSLTTHSVFTIKKGKVTYAGNYDGPIYSVDYCKKYKALYNSGWTNMTYGVWAHLFQLKSGKIKQFKYYWEGTQGRYSNKMIYKTGSSDAKAKNTSKSKCRKFVNTYFKSKNFVSYKFTKNTEANRIATFG